MTASALQASRKKLLLTVFAGRLLRFGIEGLLAIFFGKQVLEIMNSKVIEYLVYGVIAITIVGSVLSVMKWISSRKGSPRERPQPQEGEA
jgi:membrane protein DedA with SNARE-associated domain